MAKMLIPVSTKINFKQKERVNELLKAYANKIITQEFLEEKLRKMRIKNVLKYLNN
jgi:hypothetical protein